MPGAWTIGNSRRTDFTGSTTETPGPGAHTITSTVGTTKIGTKFSQDNRDGLYNKQSEFPGPGQYNVSGKIAKTYKRKFKAEYKPIQKNQDTTDGQGPGAYTPNKARFSNYAYSFGVRELPKVVEPDTRGMNNISEEMNATQSSFRKTGFSTKGSFGTAKRSALTVGTANETPGPGKYSRNNDDKFKFKRDGNYTFTRNDTSDKSGGSSHLSPGPMYYDLPQGFEGNGTTFGPMKTGKDKKRPETVGTSDTPGPGQYTIHTTRSATSVRIVPHNSRSLAKENKREPGPGSYRPRNPTWTSPENVIGTSKRRPLSEATSTPGPGEYERGSALGKGPRFTALGRRDELNLATSKDTPGPGTYFYDEDEDFKAPDGVAHLIGSGTREAFYPKRTGKWPGPGSYEYNAQRSKTASGWSFGRDKRSKQLAASNEPGPGYYNLSSGIGAIPKYQLLSKTPQAHTARKPFR
eukprot:CAMPEP_0115004326 /NCGR_PEP_ID=MMETSP0216-20121206/19130_1 /TAXON_ID=223996 /ORGANISM="Protocruzia adherens, Strain Boccale" /LENGTH=463 /DNA_ID=CAMNT_0002370281 /DNA_START=35 /DNA_END=1426 /DNA_ORIENTATION=+